LLCCDATRGELGRRAWPAFVVVVTCLSNPSPEPWPPIPHVNPLI